MARCLLACKQWTFAAWNELSSRDLKVSFLVGGNSHEPIRRRHERDAYAHGGHTDRAAQAGDWAAIKGTRDFGWRAARGGSVGRDNRAWHRGVEVAQLRQPPPSTPEHRQLQSLR